MNNTLENCPLTLNTTRICSTDSIDTAVEVSKIGFSNMRPNAVILVNIMSGEDYSEGIVSGYWAAHHGDPILFVQKNRIPECVLEVIKKVNDINIYIIGSTKTVSNNFEKYFSQFGNVKHVDRINGDNPYEIGVNFAKYKDSKTEFGWGRDYREGHAFTFGVLNKPMDIIAGVLFAHMGKHTPSLLVGKDRIHEVVERYVKSVKPMLPKDMPKPPFMHGFILGATQNISYKEQIMIEEMLSIDHEMMDMDHHMMEMHHKMMNMKHEMYDEKMGMDCDMSKMMSMHHQMMDMDDEDAMKHEHCMHHMNKGNGEEHEMSEMEEEENIEYTHEMHIHGNDYKNYEKTACNCKNKMGKEHRGGFSNIDYRVTCIDELLG